MMGGVLLIVCILAVIGAGTCVCMVIDACHGIADFVRTRRRLKKMRGLR